MGLSKWSMIEIEYYRYVKERKALRFCESEGLDNINGDLVKIFLRFISCFEQLVGDQNKYLISILKKIILI